MSCRTTVAALVAVLFLGSAGVAAPGDAVAGPGQPKGPDKMDKKIDGFLAAVRENQQVTDQQRDEAVRIVETLRKDEYWRDTVITAALREMYPEYRAALTALAEEQFDVAETKLKKLIDSDDPYLAVDAAFFQARLHILLERFEEAAPLLKTVSDENADKTLHAGEALLLRGLSAARVLKRKEAIDLLAKYLEENPHAPERMRFGAWRQLMLLRSIPDGSIIDVQDRMDYSRRRLSLESSGKRTQDEQEKIVAMLDKLIKEAEEREAQCACSGGGGGGGSQGGGGGASGGPDGGGKGAKGGNDQSPYKTLRRVHRGGKRSAWGELREMERERVFGAIKGKFPSRYRQLIEQYYKSLQDEEDEG